MLLGQSNEQLSLLGILDHTHTYSNIIRTEEWVINYPRYDDAEKCARTIQVNQEDTDEIEASGFTREESKTVAAPRIAESSYILECRLLWDKPLDDKAIPIEQSERMSNLKLMYNIRGTINPLNGEYCSPNVIGLLNRVVDFPAANE
jgi:hypothetical protein